MIKRGYSSTFTLSLIAAIFLITACVPTPVSVATPVGPTPAAPRERVPLERIFPPTPASLAPSTDRQREQRIVQSFSKATQDIDKRWQVLHQEYDAWKRAEATCTRAAFTRDLDGFVADFSQVKAALNSLSSHSNVRSISELLNSAAEDEHRALRRLSFGWRPGDSSLFEAVEEAKAAADKARRKAAGDLHDLLVRASKAQETPTPTPVAATPSPTPGARTGEPAKQVPSTPTLEALDLQVIKDFSAAVEKAQSAWDAFRLKYSQWRLKGGTCNRDAINLQLDKFRSGLTEVRDQVNALERDSLVRPMREQLIEALQVEEGALRLLRQTWEPYDATQFEKLEAQRSEASNLRRRALDGIQDLLGKYSTGGS